MLTLGQARELKSIADQYGNELFAKDFVVCVCGVAARRHMGYTDLEGLTQRSNALVRMSSIRLWQELRQLTPLDYPTRPYKIYDSICRHIAKLEEHEVEEAQVECLGA